MKNILKEPVKCFGTELYSAPGQILNKEDAKYLLCAVKHVYEKNGIDLILAYGTLLGAIREHDFISHDMDMDTMIWAKDMDKALALTPELEKYGIKMCSYVLPWIFSYEYKGAGLDVDVLHDPIWPWTKHFCLVQEKYIPRKFFENTAPLAFQGEEFIAPVDPEKVLVYHYGKDWRIPSSKHARIESHVFFWRYAHRFVQRCIRYAKRHWFNKGNK